MLAPESQMIVKVDASDIEWRNFDGARMVGKDGRRQGGMAREQPLGWVDRMTWAKGVSGSLRFLLGGGFREGVSAGLWTLGNEFGVIGNGTGCGMMVTEVSFLAGVAKGRESKSQTILYLVVRRGWMTWNGEFGYN